MSTTENTGAPSVIDELESFQPAVLRHVEKVEKNLLPSKEDIQTEKQRLSLLSGLEAFDANKLKKTETVEKVVLPDKTTIEQEKQVAQK